MAALRWAAFWLAFATAAADAANRAAQAEQIEELLANQARLEARLAAVESEHSGVAEPPARRKLAVYSKAETTAINAKIALVAGPGSTALTNAAAVMTDLVAKVGVISTALDYMWLLISGALVMFMQAGFALLESGSCRTKNAAIVLMKNIMDACVGTIAWYLVGYGVAYGFKTDITDNPNPFLGTAQFAGDAFLTTDGTAEEGITGTAHFKDWFFQWAFCATAATIVSGGVAERIRLPAYIFYSAVMTAFIYPVVVYWTWSGKGWLTLNGYDDFAGSGIVHLTGGIAALVGAVVIGPRKGRWEEPEKFAPHNMGLVVLGTFVLWFGWYGFNCGSTLSFSDVATATQASLVAMNTTISAAAGGLTVFMLRLRTKKYDLAGTCNGILAGLVAVCAGVGAIEPSLALATGACGGLAYEIAHVLTTLMKIDDPLDAFSVHGAGGMIGLVLRPLFDRTGAKTEMLGWNCVGMAAIIGWSGGITLLIFGPLKLLGMLRVSEEEEESGGDVYLSPNKMYAGEGKADAPGLAVI